MNIGKLFIILAISFLWALSACKTIESEPPTYISQTGDKYTVNVPIIGFSDFYLVKTQMGKAEPKIVSLSEVITDLAKYDVVFVGEAHGHATNHLIQSKLFSGLYGNFANMALSMEQFERSQQNIVDQYLASEIGEETLVFEGKAWPHYRSSYRPLVEFAKQNSLPIIAAEAPANLVSCIGEQGPEFIKKLPAEARNWVAQQLDLQDGAYRDKFYKFMDAATGHGFSGDLSSQQIELKKQYRYAAQVSRDETMAQSIAQHISANPGRKVFHITGSFHSAGLLGTPERLKRQLPELKLVNIHPVLVRDPNNPTFSINDAQQGQYLMLLYPVPKRFVQMKNINAFIKRTQDKLDENTCAY